MPPRPQPRPVPAELVTRGVLLVADLTTVGWSSNDVRSLLRSGEFRRMDHGVLCADAEPTVEQWVIAASRLMGAPAIACLKTATVIHGWRDWWPPDPIDLLLPRGDTRHQRRPWIRLHSWDPDPRVSTGAHPRGATTRAQTAFDVLRLESRNEAIATIDCALHRGLLDPQVVTDLTPRLSATRQLWIPLIDARSESWLESVTRLVMHDAGLHPEPQFIVRKGKVFIARVDFAWPELEIAIECDGKGPHDAPPALYADRDRDDDINDFGFRVLRVTSRDILRRPEHVIWRIRRAIAKAQARLSR